MPDNNHDLFDFGNLMDSETLKFVIQHGGRMPIVYPIQSGDRVVPGLARYPLEEAIDLPGYAGRIPEDSTCACMRCAFVHGKFGMGRN